jgi:hypothetical protein
MSKSTHTYHSAFAIFDRVTIDGDHSIVGTVTSLAFSRSTQEATLEISWFANGDAKSAWVDECRVRRTE